MGVIRVGVEQGAEQVAGAKNFRVLRAAHPSSQSEQGSRSHAADAHPARSANQDKDKERLLRAKHEAGRVTVEEERPKRLRLPPVLLDHVFAFHQHFFRAFFNFCVNKSFVNLDSTIYSKIML